MTTSAAMSLALAQAASVPMSSWPRTEAPPTLPPPPSQEEPVAGVPATAERRWLGPWYEVLLRRARAGMVTLPPVVLAPLLGGAPALQASSLEGVGERGELGTPPTEAGSAGSKARKPHEAAGDGRGGGSSCGRSGSGDKVGSGVTRRSGSGAVPGVSYWSASSWSGLRASLHPPMYGVSPSWFVSAPAPRGGPRSAWSSRSSSDSLLSLSTSVSASPPNPFTVSILSPT
mmetsp:Transcript_141466/g.394214  ORF Transcript_141466/g.394214 Transcript_141466/m.394214 type:complete len:230 (+) Transcript_141466:415-1104(+)